MKDLEICIHLKFRFYFISRNNYLHWTFIENYEKNILLFYYIYIILYFIIYYNIISLLKYFLKKKQKFSGFSQALYS